MCSIDLDKILNLVIYMLTLGVCVCVIVAYKDINNHGL